MHIYFCIFIILLECNCLWGIKTINNIPAFTSPFYRNGLSCKLFAKKRGLDYAIPSDGKKFTLEDLIEQNVLPQPPVFNNDPGYNLFNKINFKKIARNHLRDEQARVAKLDHYFKVNNKQYSITELLDILSDYGIYPYMSTTETIFMLNRFKHAINNYLINNEYLGNELVDRIHMNRGFLRIIGSLRRSMKIIQKVIIRKALLNDPKISKSIPHFSNGDIVDVFETVSLVKYKNDSLINLFIKYVEQKVDNFTISQLSTIIYHISKLDYSSVTIVKNLISRVYELDNLTPIESLSISKALVSFDFIEKNVFDKLSSNALKGIDEFDVNELIRLFKAFVSAEFLDDKFYSSILKAISTKVQLINSPKFIMYLLSSLSLINIKDDNLLKYLSEFINNNIGLFSPIQLASAARCFAMLFYHPKELFEKIFSLAIFSVIPSVDVIKHISMGYNKSQSYTAYLVNYPCCELDNLYNKIFMAYKSYRLESANADANTFKFSEENEKNLREIFLKNSREKIFTSSSIHLEIADMYKRHFNITFQVGYQTEDGLLIDLAHIDGGDKFAIEINGPFHYMQRCLSQIPPPLTASSLFKERLLKKTGWIVSNISYWDYTTWFPFEKKKCVLFNALSDKLKEFCNRNVVKNSNVDK